MLQMQVWSLDQTGAGKIPWRKIQQPTPVFLPGESHGQRSLTGYSMWGHKESDMNERMAAAMHSLKYHYSSAADEKAEAQQSWAVPSSSALIPDFSLCQISGRLTSKNRWHDFTNSFPSIWCKLSHNHGCQCILSLWIFWRPVFPNHSSPSFTSPRTEFPPLKVSPLAKELDLTM